MALPSGKCIELHINSHAVPRQKGKELHMHITGWIRHRNIYIRRQSIYMHHTPNYTIPIWLQIYGVPLLHGHIFHFITQLMCDGRDKTVVTEMSVGGVGVWNWTGNYVLQLRHAVEILKAILQCLGTGCTKGGSNGRRQFNQKSRISPSCACMCVRACSKRGERDRTAMFNNVLRIRVVECSVVYKIHNVIQLNRRMKSSENWEQMGLCLRHIKEKV